MTTEPQSTLANRLAATLFSDAMLIGALTISGYLIAFSYVDENGAELGVPHELISVSLEAILTALIAALTIIMGVSLTIEVVMSSIPERVSFVRDSPHFGVDLSSKFTFV